MLSTLYSKLNVIKINHPPYMTQRICLCYEVFKHVLIKFLYRYVQSVRARIILFIKVPMITAILDRRTQQYCKTIFAYIFNIYASFEVVFQRSSTSINQFFFVIIQVCKLQYNYESETFGQKNILFCMHIFNYFFLNCFLMKWFI